jgi:hypothetical protein
MSEAETTSAEADLESAKAVAGIIAGGAVQDALAFQIALFVFPELRTVIGINALDELSTETREKVVLLGKALAVVRELSGDPHAMAELNRHWPADVPWSVMVLMRKSLIEAAPVWQRTLDASAKGLGGRRERVSILPHDTPPEWHVAAYALLVWRVARPSETPRPGGKPLMRVCAELWSASGGGTEQPGWRQWLAKVLRDEAASAPGYRCNWLRAKANLFAVT